MTHNSIRMKTEGSYEILIYDQIGADWWTGEGVTAKGFANAMKGVPSTAQIDLRIKSPGGDMTEGFAIYDTITRHEGHVNVYIDGLAASMATIIAMTGDTIHMAANAMFMIHEPSGVAVGTAEDMLTMAALLESMSSNAVKTYAARTGRDPVAIKQEMQAETWFTAEAAKAAGYVDQITPRKTINAHFDASTMFATAPVWVQSRLAELYGTKPMTTNNPEKPEEKVANPVALVDVDKAKEDARMEERRRCSNITAACKLAGMPELTDGFLNDPAMTVDAVNAKLLDAVCKKNQPLVDGLEKPDAGSADPEMDELKKAYAADQKNGLKMSFDDYVHMIRVEQGKEPLIRTKAEK